MNDSYISEKQKEILDSIYNFPDTCKQEKFIKLVLESVYLTGMMEGIQEAREVLR